MVHVHWAQEVPQCPNLDKTDGQDEGVRKMRGDKKRKWRQIQKLLKEVLPDRPRRPAVGSIEVTFKLREMDKLTQAQQEVVRLLIDGYSSLNIATMRNVKESTVKTLINRIFRRLGVNSRTEMIRKV